MSDKQIQDKLNKLAKLCNELDDEAKRRYGDRGSLFFEAGGTFMIMDGDDGHLTLSERSEAIQFQSDIYCRLGAGAF